MADPNLPSPEDAASIADSAKTYADNMERATQANRNLLQILIESGNLDKAKKQIAEDIAAKQNKELSAFRTLLSQKRDAGKLDLSESQELIKKLKSQQAIVGTYQAQKKLRAETEAIEKMALEIAKNRKKTEEDITKEIKNQVKEEEKAKTMAQQTAAFNASKGKTEAFTNTNMGGAGARQFVDKASETAATHASAATGIEMAGPIGAILGLVKAVLDLSSAGKVAAASLIKANATAGTLVDNMKQFAGFEGIMSGLKANVNVVGEFGMTFKEMTDKLNQAAHAGVSLNDVIGNNFEGLKKLNGAAVATGVDVGTLSALMVSMKRNLKGFTNTGDEAVRVAAAANKVAKANIMNTNEFVSLVGSLTEELADLNMSVDQTIGLTKDLMLNIKNMGVSAKVTKEVTNQLIKSFHSTTDEWKAFIGAKSGAGGGFLGGLFSAQQRGAGGDVLNRQADPRVWMKQMMTTIQSQTSGIADPRARMYMAEQIGKNMGLDSKSTQALLRGVTAKGPEEQQKALDEMVDSAKKAEEQSKDWGERLAAILEATIAKVLRAILGAVVSIANHFGGKIANPLDEADKMQKNMSTVPQKAGGGEIYDSGMIIAHRGEEVLSPNEAKDYRSNRGRGQSGAGNGIALNVTVNVQGNINKAFDMAKQDTIKKLKKANAYAWGM